MPLYRHGMADAPEILSLILERPLCVECIAGKVRTTEFKVDTIISVSAPLSSWALSARAARAARFGRRTPCACAISPRATG